VQQNGDINEQTTISNVVQIVFDIFMDQESPVRAKLPQAGNSRLHRQALTLEWSVLLDDEGHFRPRSDQGHVAEQHIQNLRQFVEAGFAKNPANRRDVRIIAMLRGIGILRRIAKHRPELVHGEQAAIFADAILPE
jgi:hypothetical protein